MAFSIPAKQIDRVPIILAVVSLIAGLVSLCCIVWIWVMFHVDIPFEDTAKLLPFVQSLVDNGWSGVSFQEWVAPHATAHRIAVGRLLMSLEYKYLSGENVLFYLGSWVSIGALCYLYCSAAKWANSKSSDLCVFMLGMALIYTCSYTQTHNLIIPINSLWFISAACSAFSIYLLIQPNQKLTLLRALGSCLLAMLAAYSVFSGVIGCLIVAVLALQTRSKHALWVSALMLAFTILYVQGVKSGQELVLEQIAKKDVSVNLGMHIQSMFENRGKLFHFTVAFLSSPLSPAATLLSYLYVIPSFALILYGWVVLVRRWYSSRTQGGEAATFYLAMATIFLGTAMACFLGRGFFNEPSPPRYQTTVMLYWLSIGGLLLHSLPGKNNPRVKAGYMLLVLLMPAGFLYAQTEFNVLSVINKSNHASAVKIITRLGVPEFQDPSFPADRYTPAYITFKSFLEQHTKLRADANLETIANTGEAGTCEAMHIRMTPGANGPDDITILQLAVNGNRFQRYREVTMTGPAGNKGYLYATPSAPMSITTLFWGNTAWRGYYRGSLDSTPVTLVFDAVLGPDISCRLPAVSTQTQAG